MKKFTIWYAGQVIGDGVYATSAAQAKKGYKQGAMGTLVVTLDNCTQAENEAAKAASLVKPT